VTLPAFTAERRAAARLLLSARAASTDFVNCGVSGGRWTLTRWILSGI